MVDETAALPRSLQDRLAALTPAQRARLEARLAAQPMPETARIKRINSGDTHPLSFTQERIWFLEQLTPGTALYMSVLPFALEGALDVAALEDALNDLVARHDILRTSVFEQGGQPHQRIAAHMRVGLTLAEDTSDVGLSDQEWRALLCARVAAETQHGFDVRQGNLVRAQLLRRSHDQHALIITLHHLISDGWTAGIIRHDLAAFYHARISHSVPILPELPIRFSDWIHWQREWLGSNDYAAHLNYWHTALQGAPPVLALPFGHKRPAVQGYAGAEHVFHIPAILTAALRDLSRNESATLFMTLLAAFQTLLYRYTDQDDMVIGTLIANRARPEVLDLVGFFANTLALRADLSGAPTFRDLLRRVRNTTREAYAHQDMPFERLVEALAPQRSMSHDPVVQVVFNMRNLPQSADAGALRIVPLELPSPVAKFDLTLTVIETANGLEANFNYRTDLFEADAIARLAANFVTLLDSIATMPDVPINHLSLLADAERAQLAAWNETFMPYRDDATLHQLFEEQVARTPDAIALTFENLHLTYADLNNQANRLAHYLRTLGVGPEILVGLCIKRSLEMIISVLAILKAGGAYVPLDPNYPHERLRFMLEDSEPRVLLTHSALLPMLPPHAMPTVCIDTIATEMSGYSSDTPQSGVTNGNVAYIIYTSGSTGLPKGVIVEHKGLCNVSLTQTLAYNIKPGERVIQFSSLNFDASVSEMILALTHGAVLCLAPQEALQPGQPLLDTLRDLAITNIMITPSALAVLPDADLPALRTVIAGGEACTADLVARWGRGRRFFNAYGPTEITILTTLAECSILAGNAPIGKPLVNTHTYILDAYLQPVPIGMPGELYIGGVGVTRGYLNRPALTNERFLSDPFSRVPGGRMYKTGDLVRYLPDGNIEFIGRNDSQIKLRGYRIELDEIAATLRQHPTIEDSVVVVETDALGTQRLVAYVVVPTQPAPDHAELYTFCAARLPNYMIPAAFVCLNALPLLPNGKVDRAALKTVGYVLEADPARRMLPVSETLEEAVAHIWAEVLGRDAIGLDQNFFEIGGTSLMAVRLVALLQTRFARFVPLATIFENPTVGQLSATLRRAAPLLPDSPLQPLQTNGSQTPLCIVHSGDGFGWRMSDVAQALAPDVPVYAFHAPGVDGERLPMADIYETAQTYVAALQRIRPHGPYRLAGHSGGGIVALEMAHILHTQGEYIEFLGMFDTRAPKRIRPYSRLYRYLLQHPLPFVERFVPALIPETYNLFAHDIARRPFSTDTIYNLSQRERVWYLWQQLREADGVAVPQAKPAPAWLRRLVPTVLKQALWRVSAISEPHQVRHMLERFSRNPDDPQKREIMPMLRFIWFNIFRSGLQSYTSHPYRGDVTLFRSNEASALNIGQWRRLVRGKLVVYSVPGDHVTLVRPPNATQLADVLRRCFETL